jgi:hypothetical protein
MDLPEDVEQGFFEEIRQFEREKHMPFIDIAERTGIEKGLKQGRGEGLLEGLELALEVKFGEAGKQLMPEIRRLQDPEVLRKVVQAIKTATTVDEVRRAWS